MRKWTQTQRWTLQKEILRAPTADPMLSTTMGSMKEQSERERESPQIKLKF